MRHLQAIVHPPASRAFNKMFSSPLSLQRASYSSPGRQLQNEGGKNSLLHPLSFLLLPSSKRLVAKEEATSIFLIPQYTVGFQKTHTQTSSRISAENCVYILQALAPQNVTFGEITLLLEPVQLLKGIMFSQTTSSKMGKTTQKCRIQPQSPLMPNKDFNQPFSIKRASSLLSYTPRHIIPNHRTSTKQRRAKGRHFHKWLCQRYRDIEISSTNF